MPVVRSERWHYVNSSGSLMQTNAWCANTMRRLNKEGDQPLETTCQHHLLCASCVRSRIDGDDLSCPCGDLSHKLSLDTLQRPSEVVLKLLDTLLVHVCCNRGSLQQWSCNTCTHTISTLVPRPPHPAFVACSTKSGGK